MRRVLATATGPQAGTGRRAPRGSDQYFQECGSGIRQPSLHKHKKIRREKLTRSFTIKPLSHQNVLKKYERICSQTWSNLS